MTRIPAFIVNLPEDHDRLEQLAAQLDPRYFDLKEHIGILGRTLPDGVCLRLTNDEDSAHNKGALGIMFSHILIWEQVARLDNKFVLVLEDDVILDRIERLATSSFPEGFDIIFCGDQTSNDPVFGAGSWLDCVPVIDVLPIIEHRKVTNGAYGYLLSPHGARRLLSLFAEHLYFGHVDVRMLAYCCNLSELNNIESAGQLTGELRNIRRIIDDKSKLIGYAMVQALVTHVGMESRREREDAIGWAGMAEQTVDG